MAVPADELQDDGALVRSVQAGDLDAFTELFRRHYPAVRQACSRRLPCPLEADETAQAAFVRALERIGQCAGERQFGPWVHTIARNLCFDSLRARSRLVLTETPVPEDRTDGSEPPDSLIDRERRDQVRLALDSLPPRQRRAVEARASGSGPGEIALELGLSVGAVDSLILRGRRRLARSFQRASDEGGAARTRIATSAAAAASVAAAFSLGSSRLVSGVAAAAEAGRDLLGPAVAGVTVAAMTVASAVTGQQSVPSAPTGPTARGPAVVVTVPGGQVARPLGTPARGAGAAGAAPAAPGATPSTPAPGTSPATDGAATGGELDGDPTPAPGTSVPTAPGDGIVVAAELPQVEVPPVTAPEPPPLDPAPTVPDVGVTVPTRADPTALVPGDVTDTVSDTAGGAVGTLNDVAGVGNQG